MKKVNELKNGDFFTLVENGPVWVRDEYDRSERKYLVHKFGDVNHWSYLKGGREVFVDFEF